MTAATDHASPGIRSRPQRRFGVAILLLLCLSLWAAVTHRLRTYACPWISTSMPKAKFAADGLHLSGVDRIRNNGTALLLGGQWSYYVLIVPASTRDAEIAKRFKISDNNVTPYNLGALSPQSTKDLSFNSSDPGQLSRVSLTAPLPNALQDPRQMNHYLRFLLTYRDARGGTHHTDRCYQIVPGVNGTTNVFTCAFGYRSD